MSVTTTPRVELSGLPPAAGRAGLRGVIAAEFTKLRSVRSTYWTLIAFIVISVGIAAIAGVAGAAHVRNDPGGKFGFDATQSSLFGFFLLGQLVITVLGALAITAEYSTGMVRTSLTAMPRRGVVYAGKLIVLTVVTLAVSLVISFLSFFVCQALLSGTGVSASLFGSVRVPLGPGVAGPGGPAGGQGYLVSPGAVLTALIGTALYVTLIAMIAFAVGAILRHSAGAITTVIGVLIVIPIIVGTALPDTWRWDIVRFLPDAATQVISATVVTGGSSHLWSGWGQMGVTGAYAAVLIVLGGYLFAKRDA